MKKTTYSIKDMSGCVGGNMTCFLYRGDNQVALVLEKNGALLVRWSSRQVKEDLDKLCSSLPNYRGEHRGKKINAPFTASLFIGILVNKCLSKKLDDMILASAQAHLSTESRATEVMS